MALIWLVAAAAHADPVALRMPGEAAEHVTVALSTRSLSAAMSGAPQLGLRLGVDVRLDGGAVELAAGFGGQRTGARGSHWGVEGGVAAGVALLPVARSAALTLTPYAGAGWYGPHAAGALRLVIPAALGPTGARLPVLGELAVAFGAPWLRAGPRAALGPVWTPGLDVSLLAEAGLMLTIGL